MTIVQAPGARRFRRRTGSIGLRLAALATAVMLAVTGRGLAAEPEIGAPPPSKVERKNRAPVSNELLRVSLPRPLERTLANGVEVLILEDHRLPSVTVRAHIRGAGALFEPRELPGLASATAQLLREGTVRRSSRQIAEQLDRLGASVGAGASFGSTETVFSASGLSDNLDQWLPLAFEILLEPSFPADELQRFKDRLKVQLRQQRATPRFLAGEKFNQVVYGEHPAAVVTATSESVDALTPDLLAGWHGERYAPGATVLAIAGDVRASELLPRLEQWLAKWRAVEPPAELPPDPTPTERRRVHLVDRPNSVQTTLVAGNIAIDRRSPDYIPMRVANHILGGGPAGRLFLNLREEKGYTYGAYSRFTAVEYRGAWNASADVRTEVTRASLAEILRELRRMCEEPVGAAELAAAKRSVLARFALALEDPARVLSFALTRKLYGLPEDYWDRYPAMVDAVSASDVQRVARKYLDPETVQVVAVGDGARIRAALAVFGPLEAYDRLGKPVPPSP